MATSGPGDERDGGARRHRGLDITATIGEPVRSIADGTVIFAGANLPGHARKGPIPPDKIARYATRNLGVGGIYLCIEHRPEPKRIVTCYMHLSSYIVADRQEVTAGETIGFVGRTGVKVSPPHLHFEVRVDDRFTNPVRDAGRLGHPAAGDDDPPVRPQGETRQAPPPPLTRLRRSRRGLAPSRAPPASEAPRGQSPRSVETRSLRSLWRRQNAGVCSGVGSLLGFCGDDSEERRARVPPARAPGKLEVVPTKPLVTQLDLSLAYTPGVAEPCLEIAANPEMVWEYTARGNLVAVITNGTAVLGLGNIGPLAGKPVMEGKACLFKKFADIDVFDLEVDEKDSASSSTSSPRSSRRSAASTSRISAPECFEIEAGLRERMRIPVFHDDQHGTAIISGAGAAQRRRARRARSSPTSRSSSRVPARRRSRAPSSSWPRRARARTS